MIERLGNGGRGKGEGGQRGRGEGGREAGEALSKHARGNLCFVAIVLTFVFAGPYFVLSLTYVPFSAVQICFF